LFKHFFKRFPSGAFLNYIKILIDCFLKKNTPIKNLIFLLELDNYIYKLTGKQAVNYGNGIHTKHKHIGYHDFFIKNCMNANNIIDIGCGNGSLAADIAKNTNANVTAIDISEFNISFAKKNNNNKKITYICADALKYNYTQSYDTVVLSNVLEHIEKRVSFLKKIISLINPDKIIIRVPSFERDWRVPLKDELKVEWRLDETHFIEYKKNIFINEIESADLYIKEFISIWGEIWAVLLPVSKSTINEN
jgi:SAM-dependent methyltransferase